MTVTLSDLPFAVTERRAYDFATNAFTAAPIPVVGDQFTVQVPPLSTMLVAVPEPSGGLGVSFGALAVLGLGAPRRRSTGCSREAPRAGVDRPRSRSGSRRRGIALESTSSPLVGPRPYQFFSRTSCRRLSGFS